jgi:nesprin-1
VEKKLALEQFQLQLQSVFDWQNELDKLNLTAQLLLETCADSRVSNAVTHISTKFNALLSLAKLELKKLECEYQEHQQYELNSSECQEWIQKIRNKLSNISQETFELDEVKRRQAELHGMKQGMEQGHNMLRYALELKEKVLLSVKKEPNGSDRIHEESEALTLDFEKLMQQCEEVRFKLTNRGAFLEDLTKVNNL